MTKTIDLQIVDNVDNYIQNLSQLLMTCVDGGSSIGFLPPLSMNQANMYWSGVDQNDTVLLIAASEGKVVGTVQLYLERKENGKHRAEVGKLMTHPGFRRKGIGRLLMEEVEAQAKKHGISLLVLDTREGDPSNELYQAMGYTKAGVIPNYALSANGNLDATVFYYKLV
ncbi:GNAT family N-acetyltransferase [Priestia flexa]|uniref:GNAT family N-acetyltransferase n=1 Tax=Priestia flexa TaxID=86664 RepID=UPI001A8FFDDF|nr:GNAT family N-acetyltransferase [Priestia flexa]MBN8435047.1 GNAT family N-acetyltransferase [Priestia flexa]MCA0967450.1 GNAT family N-acetyltransferase [Priestia flexa]MED3825684.1 GNAT family N-acetyltransferase [Priestia flexa]